MDNSISNQKLTFLQRVFSKLLSILGWTIVGQIPELQKYLVVGAPHTSNWDFIYFVMYINAVGLKVGFIGKDSAFWWPMGLILKKMGGIPVNRRSRNNFVEQIIDTYHQRSSLILLITPEGTRKKTEYWKSGFYYIAHGAHIPIILGFLDYQNKQLGIGPLFYTTGNIHQDFLIIQNFYNGKTGKYPEKQGPVQLNPDIK